MLSFMIATAFLSMWTSNNSTTLMMLDWISHFEKEEQLGANISLFAPALMLSIAYSASIGGTGTLVEPLKSCFC